MDILLLLSIFLIVVVLGIILFKNNNEEGDNSNNDNKKQIELFHDGVINRDSFDVYLINMGKNVERLHAFVEKYKKSDLSFKSIYKYEAVDGKSLNIKDYVSPRALEEIESANKTGYRTKHYQLTPGAVGCHLSHQNVIRIFNASDKKFAFVFEDDCIIDPRIYEHVSSALLNIPNDWDILLLGCFCIRCYKYDTYSDMQRFFQTHGYVVSKEGAEKISKFFSKRLIEAQIDTELSEMVKDGLLKVYCLNEKLAHQDNSFVTTIQVPIQHEKNTNPYDMYENNQNM